MANKAALAAALLVAMVALATATTTTTISFEEEVSENHHECRQQVQGHRFQSCQRFLQQRSNEDEDVEVADSYQPSLQACCQELKQMDRQQCGCEAIRQAVRQAQQSTRRFQTGQSEQVYQQARALPRRCGLREQQCHFRILFV